MHNTFFKYTSNNFLILTSKNNTENNKKSLEELFINFDCSRIIKIYQTHSNKIIRADRPGDFGEYDGAICHKKDNIIPLVVTADCVPMFIFDNISGYYGLIHCGWRGVASNIHLKAINKLCNLGSNINNIHIYTGPSIKKCCYKIGEELIDKFDSNSIHRVNNKYYLCLDSQILLDLTTRGIDKHNIIHSNICTFDSNYCHSFRRDGVNSGRMYSIISPL